MAEFPALPLWTDAYLGDTIHLSTTEHGAYLLLLMVAWRSRDCCLPDDDRLLARYTKMGPRQWAKIRPVIADFFTIENGVWMQRRLTDEADAARLRKDKAASAGRASALKRKGRHLTKPQPKSNSVATQALPEGNITSTNTIEEKTKDKSLSKKEHPIPDDWEPKQFGEGSQSRKIVDSWSPDILATQAERFKAHHSGHGTKWADWQKAWSTWVLNAPEFAAPKFKQPADPRDSSGLVEQILAERNLQSAAGRSR